MQFKKLEMSWMEPVACLLVLLPWISIKFDYMVSSLFLHLSQTIWQNASATKYFLFTSLFWKNKICFTNGVSFLWNV